MAAMPKKNNSKNNAIFLVQLAYKNVLNKSFANTA